VDAHARISRAGRTVSPGLGGRIGDDADEKSAPGVLRTRVDAVGRKRRWMRGACASTARARASAGARSSSADLDYALLRR
jgi:hypothetical protein